MTQKINDAARRCPTCGEWGVPVCPHKAQCYEPCVNKLNINGKVYRRLCLEKQDTDGGKSIGIAAISDE